MGSASSTSCCAGFVIDNIPLASEWDTDEGFRGFVYDDKTQEMVVLPSGGTPTFGHGWTNITVEESLAILAIRGPKIWADLQAKLPWVSGLSVRRQNALADMALNLGVNGLLTFGTFLRDLHTGLYAAAALDLVTTKWAREVGSRALRIEAMIRDG